MPTQVLYGEQVVVLGRRGGWTRIAVPDQPSPLDRRGYPGWIRSWQLGAPAPRGATVMVTTKSAQLGNGLEVSLGTRLRRLARGPRLDRVWTPQGSTSIPSSAVIEPPGVVRTARMFLASTISGAASPHGATTAPA